MSEDIVIQLRRSAESFAANIHSGIGSEPGHYLQGQAADEIERLRAAIRDTASQGTYDEIAIRKTVGFALAELIAAERVSFNQASP